MFPVVSPFFLGLFREREGGCQGDASQLLGYDRFTPTPTWSLDLIRHLVRELLAILARSQQRKYVDRRESRGGRCNVESYSLKRVLVPKEREFKVFTHVVGFWPLAEPQMNRRVAGVALRTPVVDAKLVLNT